jgi:uncharacterized SAM-binding protein YcdF (DUF218 family)
MPTLRLPRATGDRLPVARARRRRAAVAVAVLAATFMVVAARLFVFPTQGMPARVDAVVVFDGPGNFSRLATALRLASADRASTLVVSQGTFQSQVGGCPTPIRGVKVICFNPSPATTQGEAQFAGRLARQYHWRSVTLITVPSQDTRARLRMSRCFPGKIYVVTAPLPAMQWPYQIAYESAAMFKALFLQRSC